MSSGTPVIIESEDGASHEFAVSPQAGGRSLADLLAEHGFPLNTRCGQRGLCRGCEVQLREGKVSIGQDAASAPATIQTCKARITERVVIRIPARSRIEHRPQVIDTFRIDVPCAHQPLFEPVAGKRDTAFAVDVGTTTVAVLLVDLATGEVLSRAGGFNEQIRFGDNVLTRIDAARSRDALTAMQSAVVTGTIVPLLLRACERAGRTPSRLAGGTIAGNTTMLHLLIGEDPSSLGVAPFVPRFIEGKRLTASGIGLAAGKNGDALAPDTPVQLLPGIAAYIGADITAGVYATGMIFDELPSLLVDIGTNGEIVLQSSGRLTACATAAGPAFEGSGLRCGTRAREGAISGIDLALNPFRVDAVTIGNIPLARAAGICGSAYIDFLSVGRRSGLLLESGRFDPEVWQCIPTSHRVEADGERALKIAGANGIGEPVISEVDIAVLLQAKAAIGAGIETLLKTARIEAGDISRVYLAGGFGMHLNVGHAIAAGLLPGFREEQVRVVGNTALAGALLALLDRTTLDEMEALRAQVDVLELNLQEGFEDRFVDHLMLP
ncbi:MAG: ASKHA domain-containing protein [Methylacidiphilales bacterium]|nr:ASKHA domain-containing protein [Candidatus Methylacidiphilales bacterium]